MAHHQNHHGHHHARPKGPEYAVYVRDFPNTFTDVDLAKLFAPLKVVII